jgi:hypothetical protein
MVALKAISASLSVAMQADISLLLITRHQRANAVHSPCIFPPMALDETAKLAGECMS